MSTPGSSSGTWGFNPALAEIGVEAFDRIGMRPAALTRHHWRSLRRSLGFALIDWSNRGVNLWEVQLGTIQIAVGQATYTAGSGVTNISPHIVSMLDVYYSLPNANGSGMPADRIMTSLSRSQYAAYPNKLVQGTPTQFWFQRLITPQITLYQVPDTGYPTAQVNYYFLSRIQDAAPEMGQTADVPNRFLDALADELARRLARKFAPPMIKQADQDALVSWGHAATNDQETAPFNISPNLTSYWNMG